jgi:hypothetical protein
VASKKRRRRATLAALYIFYEKKKISGHFSDVLATANTTDGVIEFVS